LDDLQWGDADSAQLLSHLVQEPNPMRVLVIASYRSADAERSAAVRALHEARPVSDWELRVGPLLEEPALELARALARTNVQDAELQALVRESAGSPLFLRSLIQHQTSRSRAQTFQQLLAAAMQRLPASSRELLELVALATRPVEPELLLRAARLDGGGPDGLIGLQRSGLLRAVNVTRGVALDTYHDRVREIVSASVDPAKRRLCHAQLAAAEALSPAPDPEFLAYQYERAAQHDAAARYAEQAGDRASAALALDRAAELYALALRCLKGQRPVALLEKLADATAHAGRCAQAAPLYLEIADAPLTDDATMFRMRLRATEMLLRRGQVSESVRTVRPVLRALGVRYPSFAPEAMFSIAISMTQLRLRRADHAPRSEHATDVEKLRRELCFVLGYRLALVDPLPGSALLLRSLVMALRSGTSAELARTLPCYAWILATLGWGSNAEHDRLLDQADELVRHLDDPDVKAWTLYGRGMMLYTRGHFESALGWLKKAHAWVAAKCTDAGWMMAEIELLICAQYVAKGEIANLHVASEPILQHLRDTGNEFQSAVLGALRSQILVAKDQPDAAIHSLDEILGTWTKYAPAIITVWSKVNTLMYQGQAGAAWQTMQKHWPSFGRAGYKRVNPWSVALPLLESTVALACAQAGYGPKYVEHVEQGIRWLERQRADWAKPSALLLRAGLSHLQGRRSEAARLYAAAADGFEQLVMLGYSNIARMRQSELMEGLEAVRVRQSAERWFTAQGILQPGSWMKMYAPIGRS
jgi:tetratricopeptide (TPR) repeat protein